MFRRLITTLGLVTFVGIGSLSVGVSGCDSPPVPVVGRDEALLLVGRVSPKYDKAVARITALEKRAAALGAPGAEITKKLAAQKAALAKFKATIDGYPAKVDAAVKAPTAAELDKVKKAFLDEVDAGMTKMETELQGFEQSCGELEKQAAAATATASAAADKPAFAFTKTLSTGYELKGAEAGIETLLCTFVEDAAKPVDKTTWFNFDRLTFATGGATLDMEKSKEQLTNIVEILKAFPKLKLKIGGYTDNTGKAADNKKLSQQRAEAVKKALVDAGVDAARLEAEGYGPEHPVCEKNDTDECKAQNRRIAVRVLAK